MSQVDVDRALDFYASAPESNIGKPKCLILLGYYIDGPGGYTFCRELERIEININGLASSTGHDPDDYTATAVYGIGYSNDELDKE